jgi:indolepyruvate ferredoxin oxidoreductase
VPPGPMVVDVDAPGPREGAARRALERVTRAEENVYLDAQRIAERALGDATSANVVVLGAAWQLGVLPVSLAAMREAFALNGVAVERNLAAFEWGRAAVAAPAQVAALLDDRPRAPVLDAWARALVARTTEHPELERLLEVRVPDLVGWGGRAPAERYAEAVARVHARERERVPGSTAFAKAVARGLHKLIAYKDEYEVARLHLEGLAELPAGARIRLHLHPPLLRALGIRRKLELGTWFVPALRALKRGRVLRGTPLDPFGYARVRRVERALTDEYLELVWLAAARLTPATLELAVEVAELPALVRGYEEIKLAGVERFRERARELRGALLAQRQPLEEVAA